MAEPRPVRLRLSRAKGFDLQGASRALNGLACTPVARPSRWGNPFAVGKARSLLDLSENAARRQVVEWFRAWLSEPCSDDPCHHSGFGGRLAEHTAILTGLHTLRGRNLACWCALDQPCHADVLLEMANR